MEGKGRAEEMVNHVREYLRTQYEITMLGGVEKLSGIGAGILTALVIVLLTLLTLLLLGFSAAYYLSAMIGDPYSGFLVVGGISLILLFLFILFRVPLFIRPFRNRIIRMALSDK